MDDDDLDAELLAVTDAKKGASSSAGAASDSEGGEFDGIADSDGDDDDDKLDADDDDADDDDEFNLDDDDGDDDYGARPKKKARISKSKQSSKSKKPSSRSKSMDRRASSKNSKSAKRGRSTDREDDSDVFHYIYDQDGFGNAADREKLAKMSEIDREVLLSDRKDDRNRELLLWEKRRELKARQASSSGDVGSNRGRSSGRSKQSSKADALKALSQDIRKKSVAPIDMDVVDADSEGEREPKKEATEARVKEESKPEAPVRDDDGPELRYGDLVVNSRDGNGVVTTPLFLRRNTLIHLSQQPYFARVIEGLFIRTRMDDGVDSYVLSRIVGVRKHRVYDLKPDKSVKTNLQLILQRGSSRRPYSICIVSGSHPTEREFHVYRERSVTEGIEIPRREEVERMRKRAYQSIVDGKVRATEAELKEHLANMETVYPRRVNWTQKRTETQTNLEIKKQELEEARALAITSRVAKYEKEVQELQGRLNEIRENESLYGQQSVKSNAEVFQDLAKRNMMLNSKNDTLAQSQKILNTNTDTLDPFSRVETTGQSYFSIKQKAEDKLEVDVEDAGDGPNPRDWRTYLLSYQANASRIKVSEEPIEAIYGSAIQGLEVFTDERYVKATGKNVVSLIPPGLDAVYDVGSRQDTKSPSGARIIGFEEWMKQRGTM